jgi:predicted transposase/invertase (TIGR01784 family)
MTSSSSWSLAWKIVKPFLRGMLNAVLGLSGDGRIVELEILNPHLDRETVADKACVLDVKAKDLSGQRFNVEVQVSRDPDYINRSLYYLARLFSEQLERGQGYDQIRRTVGLSILDFSLFPDREDLHSTYRFYDCAHQHELSDVLEIHYVELSKFKQSQPRELRSQLERGLHVLKFSQLYQDENALPPALQEDEEVWMAIKAFRQVSASAEVREMVESRMKAERDIATRLSRARQEGEAVGEARGEISGRLKTLQALIPNLRAKGFDSESIAETLQMTPEERELLG